MKNNESPEKSYLYGYLFTFNHLTSTWHCFKSEDKEKYFNESKSEKSAKDIVHILEVLAAEHGKTTIATVDETDSKGY